MDTVGVDSQWTLGLDGLGRIPGLLFNRAPSLVVACFPGQQQAMISTINGRKAAQKKRYSRENATQEKRHDGLREAASKTETEILSIMFCTNNAGASQLKS